MKRTTGDGFGALLRRRFGRHSNPFFRWAMFGACVAFILWWVFDYHLFYVLTFLMLNRYDASGFFCTRIKR